MSPRRLLLLLSLGVAAPAGALPPRGAMDAGERAYAATNYTAAAQAFADAATNAAAEALDPAVAQYNAGAASYRLGRMDAAADRLAEALRTSDLSLQERACYNRGNALVGQSAAQRQQNKLDEAQKNLTEALSMYERAILLGPNDAAAKVNYELALRLKQELEQQQKQEQQKQDQQKQQQPKDQTEQPKPDQQKQPPPNQPEQTPAQKPPQKPESNPGDANQASSAEKPAAPAGQDKKAEEMTPEEARQLLDAMRQEEQALRDRLPMNIGQNQPVEKDW